MNNFYPLRFQPILVSKIWGGEKLKNYLGKQSNLNDIGESWELSGVEDNISIVSNGMFSGQSLKNLIQKFPVEFLGNKNHERFGTDFPLLIKFIDAKKDLSVQLHPNDDLAKKRHNSFGKTEMWYVMQADKNADLIIGFNQPMNKNTYLEHLNNKTLTSILNYEKVSEGDTYFIGAGRIHAIGAGVLLAEIQQTSDITYRVYDWDRVDGDGNERELHNDIAIGAFNFGMKDDFKINYSRNQNVPNQMVSCPFFTTNYLEIAGELEKSNDKDSFVIYICVEGECKVYSDNFSESLAIGQTMLLPAAIEHYSISSNSVKLLEVYI